MVERPLSATPPHTVRFQASESGIEALLHILVVQGPFVAVWNDHFSFLRLLIVDSHLQPEERTYVLGDRGYPAPVGLVFIQTTPDKWCAVHITLVFRYQSGASARLLAQPGMLKVSGLAPDMHNSVLVSLSERNQRLGQMTYPSSAGGVQYHQRLLTA